VRVLPVRDDHDDYASSVARTLKAAGYRTEMGPAEEPLGARVRRAKLEKIPYVLVVGDDDVAAGTVGVNARGTERPERAVKVSELLGRLAADVGARDAELAPDGGPSVPGAGAEDAELAPSGGPSVP
jgi:threonyl-tRNA synthetase